MDSLLAQTPQPANLPAVEELPARPEPPDPLLMLDGTRVETPEQWKARRKELKTLIQHYMYGYLPPPPENFRATVADVDKNFLGGKATKKEVRLEFGPEGAGPIHLLVVIPNNRTKPAPVFLMLNKCGNHTVHADPGIRLSESWTHQGCPECKNHRATEAARGSDADGWYLENSIDRGYAVATFHESDVDPDKPDFNDGLHAAYRQEGQEPGPHDWGTIAAWAWGLHRAVDYLNQDDDIDHDRICLTGHSRRGKTALFAAAMDERIDLVVPHQSGRGGAPLNRIHSPKSESIERINNSFPHWFNDTYPKFANEPEKLPFDQHGLVALMAPRPLLFTNAQEDLWADPTATFQTLELADPVYQFLNAGGLEVKQPPPLGELPAGKLSYFTRAGRHSVELEDWNTFMDFADLHFGKPAKKN